MSTELSDFKITLDEATLAVHVESPAGEANATFEFPGGTEEMRRQASAFRSGVSGRNIVPVGAPEPSQPPEGDFSAEDFGRDLFNSVFRGDVLQRYRESQGLARRRLRIRLVIRGSKLAAPPWELLRDSAANLPLGTQADSPVVRHVEVSQPLLPLVTTARLSVLAVGSNPSDLDLVDIKKERARIEDSLQAIPRWRRPELKWLENPSAQEVLDELERSTYHIFHFAGHGAFERSTGESFIAMTRREDAGKSERLETESLGNLLANHKSLRLVVLNACEGAVGDTDGDAFSSIAEKLLQKGVPAVLAMQAPVLDDDAIQFITAFYGAIAEGQPIDVATNRGRLKLSVLEPQRGRWATPVLFMRSPSGALFRRFSVVPAVAAAAAVLTIGLITLVVYLNKPHGGGDKPSSSATVGSKAPAARRDVVVVADKKLLVGTVVWPPQGPVGATPEERCLGFSYCVRIEVSAGKPEYFPLVSGGLRFSPGSGPTRSTASDGAIEIPIEQPLDTSTLKVLANDGFKGFKDCEQTANCSPQEGGGTRCVVEGC